MSSSRMLTLKAAAVSAGVLAAAAAAAMAAAMAAPGAAAFLAAEVPRAYGEVRAWLTPPYLYFVINCIIISIAASARFQTASSDPAPPPVEIVAPPPPVFFVEEPEQYVPEAVVYEAKGEVMIVPPETAAPAPAQEAGKPEAAVEPAEKPPPAAESAEEEFVISRSSWTPMRRESMEMPPLMADKPLVSKRFGNLKRSPRPNPDGKALGVTRPKKGETLESTWKAITDGRAVPLTRHLKKSDTWAETRGRHDDAGAAATLMRKSDTLNNRGGRQTLSPASSGGSGGVRLKREASLGQDDLNRRVEAFINKFNEEMRLQRQESCQQYLNMINSRKK